MIEVRLFSEIKDIEDFTGLSSDELWKIGFNLDDCDGGMIIPKTEVSEKWFNKVEDEWSTYRNFEPNWMTCDAIVQRILSDWENYCVGYCSIEYNGYYFFTLHHA